MNELAPDPPLASAAEQPPRPITAARGGATYSIAGGEIFDGGDSLLDDGMMRANWAVPWSDLMMTMFVLFAALLAV